MNTIPQIIKDSRSSMDKAMESSKRELSSIRTGKASVSLLDTVKVEAYGQTMPLNQVASVSAPEPRLLTVTPWDKGLTQPIEKALRESDLGLNPMTQTGIIRVPIPALNEERRRDLVKVVHKLAEEARIGIRREWVSSLHVGVELTVKLYRRGGEQDAANDQPAHHRTLLNEGW